MKPLIEKLTLSEGHSFVARTYRSPNFEVPWHQHIEYELICFTEGYGKSYIGNHIGEFVTGDVFFLGSNLPHTFQNDPEVITSAVVVQFNGDFWGSNFLELPESKSIRQLLEASAQGLKLHGEGKVQLQVMIGALEHKSGFARITGLCECLERIASLKEIQSLSTKKIRQENTKHKERIDTIFEFTLKSFQNNITLKAVAAEVSMSIPAFCNYFRKSTKKTYIDFVNELRVGHACKLLTDTQKSILEICYESGFNTLTNFHKQFLKLKGTAPSLYRKHFNQQLENEFVPQQVNRSLSDLQSVRI